MKKRLHRFRGSELIKSGSSLNATSALKIGEGSIVGASANLENAIDVTGDFGLGVGSMLTAGSVLTDGSTLGGSIVLANDETVDMENDMLLKAGSMLETGSTITAGTYLTTDVTTADGTLHTAGVVLAEDITTASDLTLVADMTLQGGSVMKAGTKIAANDENSVFATAETSESTVNRLSDVNVMTQEGAQSAMAIADAALKDLDKVRANLGSVQNQLVSTISNISTTRVNVMSAESSIREVDFAEESSNFTKLQILQQAGTFAMSQANASAQGVLSLLQ